MKQEILDKYQKIAEQIFRDNPQATPEEVSFFLLKDVKAGYKPSQARDEDGKWTSGGDFPNSKVRNDNGSLRVVYHYTNNDFNKFRIDKARKTGFSDVGFWFGENSDISSQYGKIKKEVYLNIKNPLIISSWSDFVANIDMATRTGTLGKEAEEFRDYLMDSNIDGIKLENVDIDDVGPQNVWVALYPDQVKIISKKSNILINGKTKAGFDPDQVRDENGRWTTKPGGSGKCSFQNWFKNSKAVDENGDPQTFYHGTTHDFDEFSEERGNIENDFGVGFYFSSSYEDVASNYDDIGPDLTNRIEQLTEQLVSNSEIEDEELEYDDARELATERLHGGVSKIIPVYLSLQNPVILGGKNETWFDYEENYDEENDYYDEPTGLAVDFMEALRIEGSDYYDYDHAKIQESIGEWYGGAGATSILTALRQSEGIMYISDDDTGKLAGNQLIRKALERMGFDGIIDNNVFNKFGGNRQFGQPMTGIRPDTAHAIAFKPNQIKSTDAETYCTETGNIYKYFLELFTKAGFDPNQPRDSSGRWGTGGIEMDVIQKLKDENRHTLPKIRTSKVFKNKVERLDWGETNELDQIIELDQINKLPIQKVNILDIWPTQINININNLKRVGDADLNNNDAAILFKKGEKYFIIDGHHRIARNILNGDQFIEIRVFDSEKIINSTLLNNGFDGVIIEVDEGSFGRKVRTIIAMDPDQVKSAKNGVCPEK